LGENDASEKVYGEFVIAGGDAAEVFETGEHSLEQAALARRRGRHPVERQAQTADSA
jgi:hypothetical protein